jgi:hypothetical protein
VSFERSHIVQSGAKYRKAGFYRIVQVHSMARVERASALSAVALGPRQLRRGEG